jgi:hypothetical protein
MNVGHVQARRTPPFRWRTWTPKGPLGRMKRLTALLVLGLVLIPASAPAHHRGRGSVDLYQLKGRCFTPIDQDGATGVKGLAYARGKTEWYSQISVTWKLYRDAEPIDGDFFLDTTVVETQHRTPDALKHFSLYSRYRSPEFWDGALRLHATVRWISDSPDHSSITHSKTVAEWTGPLTESNCVRR